LNIYGNNSVENYNIIIIGEETASTTTIPTVPSSNWIWEEFRYHNLSPMQSPSLPS